MTLTKESYLKRNKNTPYRLNVEDYPEILSYYKKKYNIDIPYIINGTTELGCAIRANNQAILEQEIAEYNDENLIYAKQILLNWSPPGVSMPGKYQLNQKDTKKSDFQKYYPELFAAIKRDFLNEHGQLKALNQGEIIKLNNVVKSLKCRKKLDGYRKEKIAELSERKNKLCLSKEQAITEIKSIQSNLGRDEIVVYFFTNNRNKGSAHFEVILVKPDQIIKPVHWFLNESNILETYDLNNMFTTDLSPFVTFEINLESTKTLNEDPIKRIQPQVDTDSCGILGISYLKELFKKEAEQLKRFSFLCPIYTKDEAKIQLNCLFFPSPQVLRYSQSSLYNSVLKSMVESTKDEEIIQYKNITYKIKTLQFILSESIRIAKENNDLQTAVKNETLLKNLPEFRKIWLDEYESTEKIRQNMQSNSGNLYLSYKGNRTQEIVTHSRKENEKRKKNQHSHLLFPHESVTSVFYNPLYEEAVSKSAVKSYQSISFFNPKEKAVVSYNPLYAPRHGSW